MIKNIKNIKNLKHKNEFMNLIIKDDLEIGEKELRDNIKNFNFTEYSDYNLEIMNHDNNLNNLIEDLGINNFNYEKIESKENKSIQLEENKNVNFKNL